MTLLRIERPDGRVVGLVDWFGLHNTTMHGDHHALHADHKGLAAATVEEKHGVVALFAQECCGDVSPNFRDDPRRGHTTGLSDDDAENAARVAAVQVAVADALLSAPGELLTGPIEARTALVDFADAEADARFTIDGRPHRTRSAWIGLSMALGTAEGHGPLWPVRRALAAVHGVRRRVDRARSERRYDPLLPFVDLGRGVAGRVLGLVPVRHVPPVDPVLAWIRAKVRSGEAGEGPWLPRVMPVQLLRIGGLLVCAVPNEPTTVSGRRLRQTLSDAAPEGVRHVVISPYANAYAGYLTTAEEYQVQHYEAGYTIFGPHTLAALQTVAARMAGELATPGPALTGELPARKPRVELERLAFAGAWKTA